MNEAQWITEYVESKLTRNNNKMLALFWALPLLLDQPGSEVFVTLLLLLPDSNLKEDFKSLVPNYAEKYNYAVVATAIDSVMQRMSAATDKAKTLQSCLD